MEQQYITHLAEAYKRGYEKKYAGVKNAPEMKLHYFKAKEDLPRVQVVLSFLQGIVPAGQCDSVLDVGSGRGVFIFPLLREFPNLDVTSLDILPHRVALGDYAFDGCTTLASIKLPKSVTSIGCYAFQGCSNVASIEVDSGNVCFDSRNGSNAIMNPLQIHWS